MNTIALGLALFSVVLAGIATRVAVSRSAVGAPLIAAWAVALAHPGFWRPEDLTTCVVYTLLNMALVVWAHARTSRVQAGEQGAQQDGGG